MKKSVLVLINTMANGGAQRQVSLLATELDVLGLDVTVMHYGANGFSVESLVRQGVDVIMLDAQGPLRRFHAAHSCLRWIRRHRPSLVLSFLDAPNQLCGFLQLLHVRFKWVPSERSLTVSRSPFQALWRRLLYRRALFVTCNSEAQSAWIRQLGIPRRTVTVPNGISPEFFMEGRTHRRSAPFRFLVLARLGQQKNPWVLMRALKLLRGRSAGAFHVDWFGDDDPNAPQLREQLLTEANEHGLPVNFHFATKNVASELDSADCLVLPSRVEGTPNVILEAMARSLPCIASAISDIPEILGNGDRGWLFRSDDEGDLARAIVDFMSTTEARIVEVANSSRDYVRERFSSKRMALTYLDQVVP